MAKKTVAKKTSAKKTGKRIPPPRIVKAYQEANEYYKILELNLSKLKKTLDFLEHDPHGEHPPVRRKHPKE